MKAISNIPLVKDLIDNARKTWFVLLGVLVFVGVTLMGVEHVDFYGYGRATNLPLVGVTVPTWLFFIFAPLLTTAVYGYFHIYLIRLWVALGKTEAQIDGQPLGDALPPWLVVDAALLVRSWRRRELPECTVRHRLDAPAALLNVFLAWVAGLFLLALLWWQTMAAHNLFMTGVAGAALVVSGLIGLTSFSELWRHMGDGRAHSFLRGAVAKTMLWGTTLSFVLVVVVVSTERAKGLLGLAKPFIEMELSLRYWWDKVSNEEPRYNRWGGPLILDSETWANGMLSLAPIDLVGVALVEKPDDWLPYGFALREFTAQWCRRENIRDCRKLTKEERQSLSEEWNVRRTAELAALSKPSLSPYRIDQVQLFSDAEREAARSRAPNLTNANLQSAFLSGLNLTLARLDGAYMYDAQLEGAALSYASLRNADLSGAAVQGIFAIAADLQGANLKYANLTSAHLVDAQLTSAHLTGAWLHEANLMDADLTNARLEGAILDGAHLFRTRLSGANLFQAQFKNADLQFAKLDNATLETSDFQGAELSRAFITGSPDYALGFGQANFSGARADGTAIRNADLSAAEFDALTDFRNVFLDASVQLPDGFAEKMGSPCQWAGHSGNGAPLSDDEFFGRWRGWIAAGPYITRHPLWFYVAPPEFHDIPAIPPDPECEWKFDAPSNADPNRN